MSWFKNVSIYRLGNAARTWTADYVADKLAPLAFQPCGDLTLNSMGWVPPVEGGPLAYGIPGGHIFLALGTEKKVIPPATIDRLTRERCFALEQQQGFRPGRKQCRELKEQVIDELLPRALTVRGSVRVWLDTARGWFVVESATPARCDDVFKTMLRSFEELPAWALRTERSPLSSMTDWLATDEAPAGFTVDQDTELRASGEGKATVRYIRHTLEAEDLRRHIGGGKQCTRLAMTWSDRVSFVLTESLAIKRVAPLDALKENDDSTMQNADERRDTDLALMAGEFDKLFTDLVAALGGEAKEERAAA